MSTLRDMIEKKKWLEELLQCSNCNSLNIKYVPDKKIENLLPEKLHEQALDIMDQTDMNGVYFCFDCQALFGFFSTGTPLGPIPFKEYFQFETGLREKNKLIKEPWVQKNHFEDLSDTWQKACLKYIVTGSLRAPRTSP